MNLKEGLAALAFAACGQQAALTPDVVETSGGVSSRATAIAGEVKKLDYGSPGCARVRAAYLQLFGRSKDRQKVSGGEAVTHTCSGTDCAAMFGKFDTWTKAILAAEKLHGLEGNGDAVVAECIKANDR